MLLILCYRLNSQSKKLQPHLLKPNMDLIDVKTFLRLVINRIPKHIKHDHGLCISNLNNLLTTEKFSILKSSHEQIDIIWTKEDTVNMEVFITIHSITIKDYTYIIPPFYTCTIPTHLHPHAVA